MKFRLKITIAVLIICSLTFILPVKALVIESVTTTPSEIAPGEVSRVEMSIENNGEEDITDVSIGLDLTDVPFAPHDSASEYSTDKIKDGETEYASFKVKALNNAGSGIYKIPVRVNYYEQDALKTRSSLISLTVNSEPIIGASIEDGTLLKGAENLISIKVINKGLSDVKFMEVGIKKGVYYTLLSSEEVYVGDVDSDDFESADFKVYFKPNTPSTVRFPVILTYKDALNNEYTEETNLQLIVYTSEEAIQLGLVQKNNTATYIIVVIVLIIIYLVYRRIKKKRREKKNQEQEGKRSRK